MSETDEKLVIDNENKVEEDTDSSKTSNEPRWVNDNFFGELLKSICQKYELLDDKIEASKSLFGEISKISNELSKNIGEVINGNVDIFIKTQKMDPIMLVSYVASSYHRWDMIGKKKF